AGKSSLLRAGLVPALARDEQYAGLPVTVLTPGADPVAALAAHPAPERRVLVVDQFEEVFTLCPDEAARREFLGRLAEESTSSVVVAGLRADFYGRCLDHPELVEALQHRHLVLGPMSAAELRAAVTAPARAVGLALETGLVELLLRDLGVSDRRGGTRGAERDTYDAGALPLLAHALLATWQHRQGGRLTVAGYRTAGGIQGAVAATAERAWAELDAAGQAAARPLLLRLVRIGEDSEDTRRRAGREELIENAADPSATEAALETLAAARLVTLDADSVEITHEALLKAWPRLSGWLDADRAGHLTRQRLEEDAKAWADQHEDASLLYRGARLETTRAAAASGGPSELARRFLATSVRQWRRSVWLRRGAVALVCVFALVVSIAAVVVVRQRDEAQFRQVLAEADRSLTTDTSLSAQLTLVAADLRPDDEEVRSRLLATQQLPLATSLTGHRGAVYLTTFSPDGTVLATAGADHTARLWDVRDRASPKPYGPPLTGHTDWLSSAVFSPDGRILATTGADDTIRLWDVRDPAAPKPLGEPLDTGGGTAYLLAFSPDGTLLAAANEDRTAALWRLADPARPVRAGTVTGHTGQVRSVAFSPDGRLLATGADDATVRLSDVRDPAAPKPVGAPLTGHLAGLHSVAFNRDGTLLATGGEDKVVRLWDLRDPARVVPAGPPVLGHSAPVWSVVFSPVLPVLASAAADGTTRLWNTSEPAGVMPLGPPLAARNSKVYAAGFSPDGLALAVGGEDSEAQLWRLPPALVGHSVSVSRPAFRPDGRVLATGGGDRAIRLWHLADPARPRLASVVEGAHTEGVGWTAFRPDGKVLASASADRTVRLWDVADAERPRALGAPITGGQRYSLPVRFSPDGTLLAMAVDRDSFQLLDVRDPARPVPLGTPVQAHANLVNTLVFSRDGRILYTGSDDYTLKVWDLTDPARPVPVGGPLTGHTGPVRAAELSPDGGLLATGAGDSGIRLWDLTDPRAPKSTRELTGHTESVDQVAFAPDGATLVSGSADHTVRRWALPSGTPVGPPVTTTLGAWWSSPSYHPSGRHLVTAGSDNTVRTWDLDLAAARTRVCSATRGALDEATWREHLPQLDFQPPCDG
ncbi:WD40 repeat domain-containing protein, partial [Crossiella equi]